MTRHRAALDRSAPSWRSTGRARAPVAVVHAGVADYGGASGDPAVTRSPSVVRRRRIQKDNAPPSLPRPPHGPAARSGTCFLVGHSLSDDDLHDVMRQVRIARGPRSTDGSGRKLGTVVTLFEDPLFNGLWPEDLEVVVLWNDLAPSSRPLAEAGRRLECFLDLLCLEAADLGRHLFDSSDHAMLGPEEHALKVALEQLQTELADIPASPGRGGRGRPPGSLRLNTASNERVMRAILGIDRMTGPRPG